MLLLIFTCLYLLYLVLLLLCGCGGNKYSCVFNMLRAILILTYWVCCGPLGTGGPASGLRSWRGAAGISCRRSAGRAGSWAPCCSDSACRWDKCPWARNWAPAASASPPPPADSPPRSPRWSQCRHCPHFQSFHPFCWMLCVLWCIDYLSSDNQWGCTSPLETSDCLQS